MLKPNGAAELTVFTEKSYKETITPIVPGIWHVLGVGHSNAVIIEGRTSVILVDTLDTLERGQKLLEIIRSRTEKPVKTILYTHGHPDHRSGAGAFSGTDPEIIAFAPAAPVLKKTEMLQDIQNLRGIRQFGYALSDEENISQGIGIREGLAYGESRAFRQPTTVYDEDKVVREIDGVRLELVRLPGETDDQIMIWLPERQVLCCGDNYYGCWPNLYAIRGSQYRDIAGWLDSLDEILSYSATYLLPGHTRPLCGKEEVRSVLTGFRDAIRYVLEETLAGMNEGKDIDTLASEIVLPQEYASLPYLGEYYGCVEWTVRAIFTAYLGWFDGNPTNLHPLPPKERAEKAVALAGGADAVLRAAEEAVRKGECQWCLELCDLLLTIGVNAEAARRQKAVALTKLAAYETSANGRHYYLVCAHELENRH